MKNYIFTLFFGFLCVTSMACKDKTTYYVGKWDGNLVQIINPQNPNKNKFCISKIYVNGQKIKTDYKIGGIEFNPADYGFEEGDEFLIEIESKDDCIPSFHSKGFKVQKDLENK